jgi:hypothetical protein
MQMPVNHPKSLSSDRSFMKRQRTYRQNTKTINRQKIIDRYLSQKEQNISSIQKSFIMNFIPKNEDLKTNTFSPISTTIRH